MLVYIKYLYYIYGINIKKYINMKVKQTTVINQETGEVLEDKSEIVSIKEVPKDSFINVYLNDMSGLMNIRTQTELRILAWMWKLSTFPDNEFPGNCVVLGDLLMDKIEKDLKIKRQTIRNTVSNLVKTQVLLKDDKHRSTYYLNPKYFFKGKLSDLPKVRQVVLQYVIQDETKNNF